MTNWLITGVGSGLGRALARAALARGDGVCGTVRARAAQAAFERLAPGRAHGLVLDLADAPAIPAAVAEAERRLGRIDRLVNNAGYGLAGAIEESGLDQIRALFEVNVVAPVAMIRAVLPAMRARRAGHVVNVTSVSGLAPWSGTGIYGASKYAMQCIGLTLAQEVAPFGIAVTNVAPGSLRTDFGGRSLAEAAGDIADYEDGAHRARAILRAGGHGADPDRAAQAILAALDDPAPPSTLLLGEDALHYAGDQLAALAREFDRWRPLAMSVTTPG